MVGVWHDVGIFLLVMVDTCMEVIMVGRFNWWDVVGTVKKWIDEKVIEIVMLDWVEECAVEVC